jgi:CO dehydrogenase nickel-insertion accessory protein CooC1
MIFPDVPTPILLFIVGQTATAAWAIITTHFKVRAIEEKLAQMEKENKELGKQLRDLSDTLLLVKHSVDLLVIGKIKTGGPKE